MKFVKKHKIILIILFIFLILMFFAFMGIKELLYPDSRKDLYGARLDGITQFNVDNERLKSIGNILLEDENIDKVNYKLTGRIINFIIYIKKDLDLVTAQSFANKILEDFSQEEQKYFDFQVYIVNNNEESEIYPIVGYKHKSSTSFKWTN